MTASGAEPLRVLLVEDDRDDYELAVELLADAAEDPRRYHVEWARTYEQGLDGLRRRSHDVCLLDCFLGADDGLSLLHEASRLGAAVPIILLTGKGDAGVAARALAAGAADYLEKAGLDGDALRCSILRSIERGRTGAEHEASLPVSTTTAIDASLADAVTRLDVAVTTLRAVAGRAPVEQDAGLAQVPAHAAWLSDSDDGLMEMLGDHVQAGVAAGEPSLIVAGRARRERVAACLAARGLDVEALRLSRLLSLVDATSTSASLLTAGVPDADIFRARIGNALRKLRASRRRVRVYQEMTHDLFAAGRPAAAHRLEELWSDLAARHCLSLVCGYDARAFASADEVRHVCAPHDDVAVAPLDDDDGAPSEASPWSARRAAAIGRDVARAKRLARRTTSPQAQALAELAASLAAARSSVERARRAVTGASDDRRPR